ncbi:MAG: rhomboid family intramembrane serine protease [Rubellimicrobium sp.]|nr:rhomboid family intramembrane serine protease [Rubellimicrobium sp.]
MQPESPFNAIPPVVVALALLVAGIEIVFQLAAAGVLGGQGGIGWRVSALGDYAFSPAVWDLVVAGNRSMDLIRRFVTYAFVHGSVTHTIFGVVLLLALGKFVGEVFSAAALLVVFFASTILGAVAFGILVAGNPPLYGVYPAVYGLIGAYSFILWTRLGETGGNRLQAFRLIGVLLFLQLLFGLLFGAQPSWVADLAGFATGFVLSVVVAPGGWAALLERLRSR